MFQLFKSHPTWVRGLKHVNSVLIFIGISSHPTWVRGLKLNKFMRISLLVGSHPTWVRGLKHVSETQKRQVYVAPYVGAWIETYTFLCVLIL